MADSSTDHNVVEIIRVDDDDIHLDEESLGSVLMQDTCRNLPIALLAVNGEMRTGKSFLLNEILRHLKALPESGVSFTLL